MFRKDKNKGVKASQAEDYKLRKEGRKEIQNSDVSFWSHSIVIIVATVGFALLDAIVLYNLFDKVLDQSSYLGILMSFGIAILLNAIALPTSRYIHQAIYGIKRAKGFAILCIIVFMLLYLGTCGLRIANADMYEQSVAMPSLQNDLSSTEESVELDGKMKFKANVTAAFMCIEPLCTTVVIFLLSFFNDDELRKRIEKEEIRKIEMEEAIGDLKASISSMEANELLLLQEDERARETAIQDLNARANKLKAIARKLLAEYLQSAGASSELNHQLLQELSQEESNYGMEEHSAHNHEKDDNVISDFTLPAIAAIG